jgi:hypothetical protein
MLTLMFVAVPSTFELDNVLSLREAGGIFDNEFEHCNIEYLRMVMESIKTTPLTVLPDALIHHHTFDKINQVITDLGLCIETREDHHFNNKSFMYNGKSVYMTTFICFNLYLVNQLKNYGEALKRMIELDEYGMSPDELVRLVK